MDQRATPERLGRLLLGPLLAVAAMLGGCRGVQSALAPSGPDAHHIYQLTQILFPGGSVIFGGVMALLLYAVFAPQGKRAWLGGRKAVVWGGLVFPIVALSALLPYGLVVMRTADAYAPDPLRIEIVGEQYWWRVRYAEAAGQPAFTTANEIQVPIGRPVAVSVTSADVIHSFWIPNFGGKIDMIPGRINVLHFTAERPGVYRGVCAEFCGAQHARMAFDVVALEPSAFENWRGAQARPAREPMTPVVEKGKVLFMRGGCGTCHAVRGTEAGGQLGPDLTHVGSRRSIGAGQFPNNVGTLGGWIADSQHLKPGIRMPSYGMLAGEDLRAVAGYLDSLE